MLTLADGSKLEAVFRGDETMHFYASADGRIFTQDEKGQVREENARQFHKLWRQRIVSRNSHRRERANIFSEAKGNSISGNKKGLVILVDFPDRKMLYDLPEYVDFFNKEGYSGFGMSGSVHDYFYDQSYGRFNLTFDVVGPVTVSREYAYYGKNADNQRGDDEHPAEMVTEAVSLADPMVNYADYDWDRDGYVDQVFVMYAGYGEAQAAGQPSLIWPHEWKLSQARLMGDGSGRQRKDGVLIDSYACSSELRDSVGTQLDGIGSACHEFSHCLGLPDMYDTDETDGLGFGMGIWSIMDAGSYGGRDLDGTTPTGFTSYERMFCGWLKPEELTDPCKVAGLPALSDAPKAYILYNGGHMNEYYLFENRQQSQWYAYLPGHGMLVLHVDFDAQVWQNNLVNSDNSHPCLTIIPADNRFFTDQFLTAENLAGDPYPGTKGNTELTDTSLPAAQLYHENVTGVKRMGHPVTDISEHDGLISFTFDGGSLIGTPEALPPQDVSDDSFTAVWTPVENADYYEVSLSGTVFETEDVQYIFSGLCPDTTYYYKVRAVLGDIFGEWSNTVSVELSDITSIEDVNARGAVLVLDLQGRRVPCTRKGIYILNGRKAAIMK